MHSSADVLSPRGTDMVTHPMKYADILSLLCPRETDMITHPMKNSEMNEEIIFVLMCNRYCCTVKIDITTYFVTSVASLFS